MMAYTGDAIPSFHGEPPPSMDQSTIHESRARADSGSPHSSIAERGIVATGMRIATAMSDAPRALLARVPVVVLPEIGFVWQDYSTILDRYAPERRVFALDWPGFGSSEKPAPSDYPYTTAALAETLGGWLDGLGIARAVFVATGVAATTAIRFAAAHPRRAAGLALIAPIGFANETRSSRVMSWAMGRTWLLRSTKTLATSLALGPTTGETRAVAERHHALRDVASRNASLAAMSTLWRDALRATDISEIGRGVRAPAQVFRGALDPIVTASEARRAAESVGERGALEVTLPGAGHLAFLQQPTRFFQALEGLIQTAELAAAQLS